MPRFAIALLYVLALATSVAQADEKSVRDAFSARFNGAKPESVTRLPIGGLYEIVVQGHIFYTDGTLSYIMNYPVPGHIVDLRGGKERDITGERSLQLTAQTLRKSVDAAVKRVKGNGKRILYTFEDPNCPYCKKLHSELARVDNVTVYTFLLPILSQDSAQKSKRIWCAKDRARAWDEAMEKGVVSLPGRKDCATPFEKNMELAQRFGVRGTPAVYLANGEQIGGYIPADKIERALASLGR